MNIYQFYNYFKPRLNLLFLSLISCIFLLTGCDRKAATDTDGLDNKDQSFILRYQDYPGRVSLPELAEDLGFLGNIRLDYKGSIQGGPENMQAMISGDVDYSSAFNGAIVKLALATRNSPNSIVAVVGSNGSDKETYWCYCVLADSPIRTAQDLIGKKVAGNTLGAHVEFILREWLQQNGLKRDEAKQVQLIALPPVATEQALRQGQIQVAAMNDIVRDKALERGGLRQLFADIDLYGEFTSANYVFTRRFTQQHPTVVQQFVKGVAQALQWSREQPREVVQQRMRSIIAKRKRNENDALVQYWKSYGVVETNASITSSQYQPWIDFMVTQGELKANEITPEDIFSNQFNPFVNDSQHAALTAKEGVKNEQ
ncbi:ABC transporter substrate-binding protein [Acinetobacter puyangensis]|uniref:ABC-type nitrate/sulfonate/bicarbonate transport system, substrate-binding protein n=1 Tax=Acinetobacter puyangensis TaxID=1096779 RepID=A0A240E6U1_9GAMM|nr:ABC transporter substrate-binding protein [Acinetobacter puyangensis]SNX44467.1 ABC-type nitrate/sulfonate/bicarbonate transport system, substrate-binding protein [Acinetobacter puyangensis]